MERTLSALFDHRSEAMSAVEELVKSGVSRDHISVVSGSEPSELGGGGAAYGTEREEPGFWASLANLFTSDEERRVYDEGISRGGATVIARVDEEQLDQAIDILENHNAVDLDERERNWREGAGEDPYMPGAASVGMTSGASPVPTTSGAPPPERSSISEGETPLSGGKEAISVTDEQQRAGRSELRGGRVRIHTHMEDRTDTDSGRK